MTVEISNIYSYIDNLILFGDYNINLLSAKGRESHDIFTANKGLFNLKCKLVVSATILRQVFG